MRMGVIGSRIRARKKKKKKIGSVELHVVSSITLGLGPDTSRPARSNVVLSTASFPRKQCRFIPVFSGRS